MSRIVYIICLLFFCIRPLDSSASNLDSLLNLLSNMPELKTSENLDERSILCNDIAVCYQGINENNKARFYFLQSISLTKERIELEQKWNDQNIYDMASLYGNLSTFEAGQGNKVHAEEYLNKAEYYYVRLKGLIPAEEYNDILVSFYQDNFVLTYHFEDFEKGEAYLLKAEALLESSGKKSRLLALNHRLKAEVLYAQERHAEGLPEAIKALEVFDAVYPEGANESPIFVRSYLSGLFHLEKYQELIGFMNQRRGYKNPQVAHDFMNANPKLALGTFVDNIFILSYSLMNSYKITNDIEQMIMADKWQQCGFQIAEDFIVSNNADKIGNVISDPDNKILGSLICLDYLNLHEDLSADKIVEAIRMIDVQQSARLHLERIAFGLNGELSNKERRLKNELIYVNLKLDEATKNNAPASVSDSLSDVAYSLSAQIQDLNKLTKHDKVLEEYEIGQGQFKNLLNQFIDRTNKNVLTYFFESQNDSLYIIGANKNQVFFESLTIPFNFGELIAESYQLNAHLQSDLNKIERQRELNNQLYGYLIAPIKKYLSSPDLLIFPNNEISYVSFDALLSDEDEYLASSYAIQYTSSLFSLISEEPIQPSEVKIASYYPSNYGADSLAQLVHGEMEVNEIQNLLGGKVFSGKSATMNSFLIAADKHEILHLASHSILNIEHPYESYILFDKTNDTSNNQLFAYEIFSKTLDAKMVTLSSCNSANGAIEEGIGIVSLANAFYFAGVPSTISSLWSAQDKSSAEIMIKFYHYLQLGFSKSESLQRAKIDYLQEADKIQKQPFFWANYVVYGSDEPLFQREQSTPWWKYVFGSFLVVLLFFLGRKLF